MSENYSPLISSLNRIANLKNAPPKDLLDDLVYSVTNTLYNENPVIRPRDKQGFPGGLIRLSDECPTLIVPDIHGRRDFVMNLLNYKWEDEPVLESLIKGRLQIVCVGDGFHTERRGAQRWRDAYLEYVLGFKKHKHMDREMGDSLGVMAMIMMLKCHFPDLFHFLKGNHENIKNENNLSDRSFGKYAYEGAMVRDWVEIFLGTDFLDDYSTFEQSLPIFVQGGNFLISHAEPLGFHNREDIINYRSNRSIVFDFSWTGNGEAREDSVDQYLNHFLPGMENVFYFGGHRPVSGLYHTRAKGRYVQIHNPDKEIVALIRPQREIDLGRDIIELKSEGIRG